MIGTCLDSILYGIFMAVFIDKVFNKSKYKMLAILIPAVSVILVLSIAININFNIFIGTFLILFPLFMSLVLINNISKRELILLYFTYTGIICSITSFSTPLYDYNLVSVFKLDIIINLIIFVLALPTIILFNKRISNYVNNISFKIRAISCSFIWLSGLLFFAYQSIIVNYEPDEYMPVLRFFNAGLLLLVGISVPVMISSSISKAKYKAESDAYKEIIKNQIEYYNSLAQANHEFRKFRHDYKNLKLGLDALLEAGQYDEAKDFLESSDKELLDTVKNFGIETGNSIINGILASKIQMAKSVNATFDFFGYIPSEGIKAYDLCRIMGNILDNALEACSELPNEQEKIIRIHSQIIMNSDILILKVQNPSPERVINNNKVETSKSDKESHGFGISNVKDALKEYDGEMTLSYRNGKFTTEIHMKIKTDEE